MLGSRVSGEAGRRVGGGILSRIASAVRRIAGMPDYEAHVVHMRQCHPEQRVPSAREYYTEFLRSRYEDGPTRCC
jgi:uncharacterized short protein YbdD (DUF466 family)